MDREREVIKMKKVVSLRLTIKDIDGIILSQVNTYGAKLDERTILCEGDSLKAV